METEYYNIDNVDFEIIKIECNKGEFQREDGTMIPYKNYKMKVKINDYPMIFSFKLDKVFNEYLGDALSNQGDVE